MPSVRFRQPEPDKAEHHPAAVRRDEDTMHQLRNPFEAARPTP
ncbi:hypothetical protein [Saccharopolyspora soli]|nr:hypothetical protein [Saccharopolyspora soli]